MFAPKWSKIYNNLNRRAPDSAPCGNGTPTSLSPGKASFSELVLTSLTRPRFSKVRKTGSPCSRPTQKNSSVLISSNATLLTHRYGSNLWLLDLFVPTGMPDPDWSGKAVKQHSQVGKRRGCNFEALFVTIFFSMAFFTYSWKFA